ncbi:hypothetical protein CI610_00201 [invertebrate metagenome]|uniref:Uncharacterized protein n=1 Tax=invertebrate metagenome TaxID=1711999 RepID=A0A2H9TC04_9ZZZZ
MEKEVKKGSLKELSGDGCDDKKVGPMFSDQSEYHLVQNTMKYSSSCGDPASVATPEKNREGEPPLHESNQNGRDQLIIDDFFKHQNQTNREKQGDDFDKKCCDVMDINKNEVKKSDFRYKESGIKICEKLKKFSPSLMTIEEETESHDSEKSIGVDEIDIKKSFKENMVKESRDVCEADEFIVPEFPVTFERSNSGSDKNNTDVDDFKKASCKKNIDIDPVGICGITDLFSQSSFSDQGDFGVSLSIKDNPDFLLMLEDNEKKGYKGKKKKGKSKVKNSDNKTASKRRKPYEQSFFKDSQSKSLLAYGSRSGLKKSDKWGFFSLSNDDSSRFLEEIKTLRNIALVSENNENSNLTVSCDLSVLKKEMKRQKKQSFYHSIFIPYANATFFNKKFWYCSVPIILAICAVANNSDLTMEWLDYILDLAIFSLYSLYNVATYNSEVNAAVCDTLKFMVPISNIGLMLYPICHSHFYYNKLGKREKEKTKNKYLMYWSASAVMFYPSAYCCRILYKDMTVSEYKKNLADKLMTYSNAPDGCHSIGGDSWCRYSQIGYIDVANTSDSEVMKWGEQFYKGFDEVLNKCVDLDKNNLPTVVRCLLENCGAIPGDGLDMQCFTDTFLLNMNDSMKRNGKPLGGIATSPSLITMLKAFPYQRNMNTQLSEQCFSLLTHKFKGGNKTILDVRPCMKKNARMICSKETTYQKEKTLTDVSIKVPDDRCHSAYRLLRYSGLDQGWKDATPGLVYDFLSQKTVKISSIPASGYYGLVQLGASVEENKGDVIFFLIEKGRKLAECLISNY